MLNELGLNCKVNPQNVSAELHKKAKALDNEVVERVTLVPEHVFKGLLVSTLKCQDCMHTSNCVESFLDLSLPIMADKVWAQFFSQTFYFIVSSYIVVILLF